MHGGQTIAVLTLSECSVPALMTTLSTCRCSAFSGADITLDMLSQSSNMLVPVVPNVLFSKSSYVRMPVPDVWIQYPGLPGVCAARPRAMASAEARWSQLAKSG